MGFCNCSDVSSDQRFPCVGVVIPQTFRILPMQTHNVSPDIAQMVLHFIRCLFQIDRVICLGEQAVLSQLYHAGTLRYIGYKLANIFRMGFLVHDCIQKIRGSSTGILLQIFFVFRVLSGAWDLFYNSVNQALLTLCCGLLGGVRREPFGSLTGSHVLEQSACATVLTTGSTLAKGTGHNDFRHGIYRCWKR